MLPWGYITPGQEICILVQLLPGIIYQRDDQVLDFLDGTSGLVTTRAKQEPNLAVILVVLKELGMAGTGTGVASLGLQNK